MIKIATLQSSIGKLISILKSGDLNYSIIWIIIFILVFIIGSGVFPELNNVLEMLLPGLVLGTLFITLIIKYLMMYFLGEIKRLNKELSISKYLLDEINGIERKISSIQRNMKRVHLLKQLSFGANIAKSKYNYTDINPLFRNFFKNECEFIASILTDLRSDLQLRLEEQQKTLEQAKSEVEANIHGTTELEQVSELQKARLDRQIEQFEELQRVLVKV